METSTPPPEPAFTGWTRIPGQRWRPVVQGETQWDCTTLLLARPVPAGVTAVDSVVLPAGQDPNRPPFSARPQRRPMGNQQRPGDIVLRLRSVASSIPEAVRLKRLLKACLRAFAFRAVEIREVPAEAPTVEQPAKVNDPAARPAK